LLINSTINRIAADNSADNSILREEWHELIKPMIYKRLEWAVTRIIDYNIQWSDCKHSTYEIEKNK
jgi:hypothetical protein